MTQLADLLISVFGHPWVVILSVALIVAGWVAVVWIRTDGFLVLLQHRLEDRTRSALALAEELTECQRQNTALRAQAKAAGLPTKAPAENVPRRKR